MTNTASQKPGEETFKNPDTRERRDWVKQAISVAEQNSQRAFEQRADDDVATAASPFSD